jgi:hypothetical protein
MIAFRLVSRMALVFAAVSWLPASGRDLTDPAPGKFLLASAEGLSVFDRDGEMTFGHFSTTTADGKPGPVDRSDMIYDGWRLPSGNYLCASHHFVREMAADGRTLWEFRVKAPVELKTCVPLPNGDVMTVDGERMELVQLADQGRRIARRIPVPTDAKAPVHFRYNLLRRTLEGTFLLALRSEKAFIEIDETGKELWRHAVPGLPVVAERLANGHTLMSWRGAGGSRGGLLEVSPDGSVVWRLLTEEVAGFGGWFGGFHRFENGNTLIANSDWHYRHAKETAVQVLEVTRDKNLVWSLGVEAFAGKKTGSLEPRTGNIEHRIIGIQWLGGGAP